MSGYVIPVTTAFSRFKMRDKLSKIWLLEAIESFEWAAANPDYSHIATECKDKAEILRLRLANLA